MSSYVSLSVLKFALLCTGVMCIAHSLLQCTLLQRAAEQGASKILVFVHFVIMDLVTYYTKKVPHKIFTYICPFILVIMFEKVFEKCF